MSAAQRYRIKTVAEMTGIPRNTLLAWERRHGIVAPMRLENGYRLYSDEDVRFLLRLKAEVERGVAISQALASLEKETRRPVDDLAGSVKPLFDALVAFDRARAETIVAGLGHVPYARLIDELYLPLMRRVGDGWEAGTVAVAQEHHASAFVREQLVSMLLRLGASPRRGPHVACVTFPGERHELGLLALTVHLGLGSCRVTYLGVDVPERGLVDFLDRVRPDVLCVSAIMRVEPERLAAFARKLRREAPATTRIAIGGAGLPPHPKPIKGVELIADWHDLVLS